ncbi:MAG: winged helix-turn-helix transcriptional regulator [Nanoarchaeales archaeon]|nr:winged helix-turn-helix transcriptional regulator [Nanoarchaeales archaeon]
MIELDLKDRKILFELDRNSRQTNSTIAKLVNLNKTTVNYKINRLIDEGIISNFYTVIDNSKLGLINFRVYFKFLNTDNEKETEILNWLISNNLVSVVGKIENIYDVSLIISVKTILDFNLFLFEFKKKFRTYFWKEKIDIISKIYHFKRTYLLDKKTNTHFEFEVIGENNQITYDKIDYKILQLLSDNARISTVEISNKLKLPVRTTAYRIKQLEKKKVIVGYRANINLNKINFEYYKINLKLDNFQNFDKLFSFAKSNPNIIYIDNTIGDIDFEIDIEIENKTKLYDLLGEIKKIIKIRDYEVFTYEKYLKLKLIP